MNTQEFRYMGLFVVTPNQMDNLIELLDKGWEIVTATSDIDGVQYVIRKYKILGE